jgi:hypothetical protein
MNQSKRKILKLKEINSKKNKENQNVICNKMRNII